MSEWIAAHLETERLDDERRREVRRYGDDICEAILDEVKEVLATYGDAHPDSCPEAAAGPSGDGWEIAITRQGTTEIRILFLPADGRIEVERGGKVDVEVAVDRRRAPLAQSVHRIVYFRYNNRDWALEDFVRFIVEPYLFSRDTIEKTAMRHPTLIDVYKHVYEDVLRGRR